MICFARKPDVAVSAIDLSASTRNRGGDGLRPSIAPSPVRLTPYTVRLTPYIGNLLPAARTRLRLLPVSVRLPPYIGNLLPAARTHRKDTVTAWASIAPWPVRLRPISVLRLGNLLPAARTGDGLRPSIAPWPVRLPPYIGNLLPAARTR
ncbi:hypothetical protein J6590_043324 [Homalodisca vitripennis]|nr:hypothetical protein J6590_043324 [Homalodisca vitripennis]